MHGQQMLCAEEPDERIVHVRVCGGCALKCMKFSSLRWLLW